MASDNKIKVFHISQVQGGIQTYIEHIVENIDKEKFELVLACPAERESLIKMAAKRGLPYLNLEMKIEISPLSDIKSIIDTVKLVKQIKPDIIHAHSSKAGMIVRLASVFFKPKVAYTPNAYAYLGKAGIKRTAFKIVEQLAIPVTNFLLAASKSEAKRSINDLKFPKNKVVVFPNSIDIIPVQPKKIKYEKRMVTKIARLVDQKNPLMFLRVCKIITDLLDDVSFQIIGAGFDDKLKPEMDKYMTEHNLLDKISILSWMDRIETLNIIQSTDVFVMTSAFESFGYVVAEAQMLEIPVVATNVDGFNEIIEDGKTGYLINSNEDQLMADKIIYILDNPDVGNEMGKRGRTRVSEIFDIKKNIKILEDFYTDNSVK